MHALVLLSVLCLSPVALGGWIPGTSVKFSFSSGCSTPTNCEFHLRASKDIGRNWRIGLFKKQQWIFFLPDQLIYSRALDPIRDFGVAKTALFPPSETIPDIPDELYFLAVFQSRRLWFGYRFIAKSKLFDIRKSDAVSSTASYYEEYWNHQLGLEALERRLQDQRADPYVFQMALRKASACGDLAIVDRLLQDRRVDPSALGNEAFFLAVRNGHLPVVERLLQDERVDPSDRFQSAIGHAVYNGHMAVVDRLLQDERVNPVNTFPSIFRAPRGSQLPIVERLLQDERVDPSAFQNRAIIMASRHGHLDVVERLLQDARVDPSDEQNEAIIDASERDHLDVVDRLLQDARVDPSDRGNQAIKRAVIGGRSFVAMRLLQDERVRGPIQTFSELGIATFLEQRMRRTNVSEWVYELEAAKIGILSILANVQCAEANIPVENNVCTRFTQWAVKNPLVVEAYKQNNVPAALQILRLLWKNMERGITVGQVRFLWNPKGPRARKQFAEWES